MSVTLGQLAIRCITKHGVEELAIGFLRYETLRRLSPRQFAELHKRNLNGELFDNMVTEELLKWKGEDL